MTRSALPVLLALLLSAGCALSFGTVPERRVAGAHGFRAGAAEVDLTPPPGFPLGGHSLNGAVSRGYWQRLYARSIWMEDPNGLGFALVATDLWSMPEGLVDEVARLLADRDELRALLGERVLGREQLLVSASHTHHSPSAFASDPFFTAFAGAQVGFDRRLFRFLAQRIALAVAESVRDAEPARVMWSAGPVSGVFRNRSYAPFYANGDDAQQIVDGNGHIAACAHVTPEYPDAQACRAVDAQVRVLTFFPERGRRPLAVAAFASAHPTAVAGSSALYSSDVFGALAHRLKHRLTPRGADRAPIVAIFNGAEGDVSFAWRDQTRVDVVNLSKRLADAIAPLTRRTAPGRRDVTGQIQIRAARTRLKLRRVGHSVTPLLPMPGRATIAGAEDGRSGMFESLFHEGARGHPFGLHGTKIGAIDFTLFGVTFLPFTRLATFFLRPPGSVYLSVYGIGPLRIVSLPGEFTTVMGSRLRGRVATASGIDKRDVLAVGLAQSYAYYFTTPEEYAHQHYEGSGMMWGPRSGNLLSEDLAQLAGPAAPDNARKHRYHHFNGLAWRFNLKDEKKSPHDDLPDTDAVLRRSPSEPTLNIVTHCWQAAPLAWPVPGYEVVAGRPQATTVIPRVWITSARDPSERRLRSSAGLPQDDTGMNMVTLAPQKKTYEWCARWIPGQGFRRGRTVRFGVQMPGAEPTYSDRVVLD